ncbi:hypothetical protein [Methylobacterium sp. WCS2018Hpa-22]|uniref:hypothetical protein n=1 Tax=Methylobacterium sp. WCS2018Hpa-22 TaxID=3073633 RepID=UPI0028895BD1|nr:hypothetical protein [Methylobacterium sp. WCS2018Hpa-22]
MAKDGKDKPAGGHFATKPSKHLNEQHKIIHGSDHVKNPSNTTSDNNKKGKKPGQAPLEVKSRDD